MRANSSSTNFVTNGNVRQNAQTFNPDLYNKTGAVTGFPGPSTAVAAAAGSPGPQVIMKGGRSPSRGADYHSFEDSAALRAGVYGKSHAPVQSCNNNQCGGKKTRRKHSKGRGRKHTKGVGRKHTKGRGRKHTKGRGRKHTKGRGRKHTKGRGRRTRRTYLRDVRDLFRMGGGDPASVPKGTTSNGYHQYMSNQPFSNSYSAGGDLSPNENALANPVLIRPTDNCN